MSKSTALGLIFLATISGAVSLAGEAAWLRWAALQGSDDRTAWMTTTLVFCLGGCLGAGIGAWKPKLLWALDALQAIAALVIAWFILDGLLYWSVPVPLMGLAMLPSAIAIGAHAPLYTRLFSKKAFGIVQAMIAGSGVLGVFLFAVLLVGHIAVSTQFIILGSVLLAGAIIAWFVTRNIDLSADDDLSHPLFDTSLRDKQGERVIAVLLGVFGMWSAAIALRQIMVMSDTDRIASFGLMMATLTAAAVGSAIGVRFQALRDSFAPAAISAWPIAIVAGAGAQWLLGAGHTAELALVIIWIVGSILCLPCFMTAAWFAAAARQSHNEGRKSGQLMSYCAIGNGIGFVIAILTGVWGGLGTIILLALAVLAFDKSQRFNRISVALTVVGAAATVFVVLTNFTDAVWVRNRTAYPADMGTITSYSLTSHGLGQYGIETHSYSDGSTGRTLTLEGRTQSGLGTPYKYQLGLMTGRYFEAPVRNALELGVGSGQTLYGLSFIARHIDAVDNDPITPYVMQDLVDANGSIYINPAVTFDVADGMEKIRSCETGHYDIIARIVSGPSLGSALKFYGQEGIDAIKRCLAPDGVYQAYFWSDIASDHKSLDLMLAPLLKSFRHVDVHWAPYLVAVAYDQDRAQLYDPVRMPAIISEFHEKAKEVAALAKMDKNAYVRDVVGPTDIPNSINGGEMEKVSRDLYWPRVSGAVIDDYPQIIEAIKALPRRGSAAPTTETSDTHKSNPDRQ